MGAACLVVVTLVAAMPSATVGIRPGSVQSGPWFTTCENTIETRSNVTDDTGALCSREDLDYYTGCCREGSPTIARHTCEGCNHDSKCCSSYAVCVSCCLGQPKEELEAAYHDDDVFRVAIHPNTGHWTTDFEYCTGQCRTSPLVTYGENEYRSDDHFCYGKVPRAAHDGASNPVGHLPRAGLSVVLGDVGADCQTTCQGVGKQCEPDLANFVNMCEVIEEYTGFHCGTCVTRKRSLNGPGVESQPGKYGKFVDGDCYQVKHTNFGCYKKQEGQIKPVCPCI